MRKKLLGLLLSGALFMSQASAASIPNGAIEYNGHYYYVYANTGLTWNQAVLYCESLGGHLATMDSPEENQRVYQIMKRLGYSSAYFGLTDVEREGHWKWVDGKTLTWSNWNPGEPNNLAEREHYALFWAGAAPYKWIDGTFGPDPADTTIICEWDSYNGSSPKTPTQKEAAPNVSYQPVSASQFAQEVLDLVNAERSKRGVAPLRLSQDLMDAAAIRANEITEFFSHTRPNGQPCHSLINQGAYTVGENIAGGSATPVDVVNLWMNSSGHRANILNPDYEELGVGYVYKAGTEYGHYWVQMFRRPMSKSIIYNGN